MPSPLTAIIERDFPDYFTTAQVAEKVGRSKRTVERWRKRGLLSPPAYTQSGSTTVWLYTADDIKRAVVLANKMQGAANG